MKSKFFKQISAFCLAVAMLVTAMPVYASDITAPVVEEATFLEAGEDVEKGQEIHIQFTGYDHESSFSIEDSYVALWNEDDGMWHVCAEALELVEGTENEYVMTFMGFDPYYLGEWEVRAFCLADSSGNSTYYDMSKLNDGEPYSYNMYEVFDENITVSSVSLSKDIITLTDDVLSSDMKVEIRANGAPEDTWDCFDLVFVNEDGGRRYFYLFESDETGVYSDNEGIGHWYDEGTYTLDRIYYDGKRIAFDGEYSFTVEKDVSDKAAPVVEEYKAYYISTVEGEESAQKPLVGGPILQITDSVVIQAKVADETKVDSVETILICDRPEGSETNWINMEYDEESGYYTATISMEELGYPTEYYVTGFWTRDQYYNDQSDWLWDDCECYFYLQDTDGTCAIRTYDYPVEISGTNISTMVTSTRVTSLTELFPNGVPYDKEEGREFIGWYVNGQLVSETDYFAVGGGTLYIRPIYDINDVEVRLEYYNEDGNIDRFWDTIEVPFGTTYGEVLELYNNPEIMHYEGLTFTGWAHEDYYDDMLDEVVNPDNSLWLYAQYEENPVCIRAGYINEDGIFVYENQTVCLPEGTTYGELYELIENCYVHHASLTFAGWEMEGYADQLDEIVDEDTVYVNALYEEDYVILWYWYYAENLAAYDVEELILVEEGTTYQDVIDEHLTNDIKHSEELGFVEWNVEIDSEAFTDVIKGGASISADAVYENNIISLYYYYFDEDMERQTIDVNVVAEAGATYADVVDVYMSDIMHAEDIGFIEWDIWCGGDDSEEVITGYGWIEAEPVYEKNILTIDYWYYDVDMEWTKSSVSVATEENEIIKDIVKKALGNVVHHTELGFVEWLPWNEDWWEDTVEYNMWIDVEAAYANTLVYGEIIYNDEQLEQEYDSFELIVDATMTYAELIDEMTSQITIPEQLTLVSWGCNIPEEMMNQEIGYSPQWILLYPIYEEILVPVSMRYLDKDGEVLWEDMCVIAEEGMTYQELYDSLTIECEHFADCVFTGWDAECPYKDLSGVITKEDEDYLLILTALYEKYPVTYSYSYVTKNNEYKTVTEELMVPAGTAVLDYFDNLTLPSDAKASEQKTWYVNDWYDEVNIHTLEVLGAIKYEGFTPVLTQVTGVDANKDEMYKWQMVYLDAEITDENAEELIENALIEQCKDIHGLKLEGYEYLWYDVDAYETDVEGYYCAPEAYVVALYETSMLYLYYPDESVVKVELDIDEEYTLPEEFMGYEIEWYVYHINYGFEAEGGEVVEGATPFLSAIASFVDDTIEIEPVTPPATDDEDTKEPETPSKPEEKPVVKLEETVIAEKVEVLEKVEEGTGEAIVIEMTTSTGDVATEVPVEILETIKGKDIEVVLDMGDYSWTVNGKDVLAKDLEAINLEVKLDTEAVAPSIVDKLAKGDETRQLSLTHEGDFGFKASLTINVGKENVGEYGNLYYHDSNGKLVFMNAGVIDESGNVTLDFSHASDYVVVIGEDRTNTEIPAKGEIPVVMPCMVIFIGVAFVAAGVVARKKFA